MLKVVHLFEFLSLFGIVGVTDKCLDAVSTFCSNTITTLEDNGCIGIKRQSWLKPNSLHACITTYRLVIQTLRSSNEVVDCLHNVLYPFTLQRLKRDVEKQFPMKQDNVIYCRLSSGQLHLLARQ